MDWITHDEEISQDVTKLLDDVDTAIYGRITYQMMESYWPNVPNNPNSTEFELNHADWVENIEKIVFSKSLEKVEWNNTKLIKDNIAQEISKLKQKSGKKMMIFGSPSLTHTLMQLGLIDEYRLNINPIVLGQGIPLFKDVKDTIGLNLFESKTFKSGVIGLHYQTAGEGMK